MLIAKKDKVDTKIWLLGPLDSQKGLLEPNLTIDNLYYPKFGQVNSK